MENITAINTSTQTIRILIGNNVPDQGIVWASVFKSAGAFAITRNPNGLTLLQYLKENPVDVIIVEASMPGIDICAFIRELQDRGSLPLIIVTADYEMPIVRENVISLGARAFVVKPVDVNGLISIISSSSGVGYPLTPTTTNPSLHEDNGERDLECIVTDIIHQIGIPAHIKGYHFLRYAIIISVGNTEMINCITKMLYPSVACHFKTTPSRVERAIRHAIELAWDRGDVDTLNSYFGYTIRNTKGKPTNSEFIALISDKLRLQIKTSGYALGGGAYRD